LINDIAGYTEKYYDEIPEKEPTEFLIKKYRAEYKLTEN
jgi:ribosomal protein S17E